MNTLFKSIGVLCIVAYIMGILTSLMPYNYTQKAIRLTIAIYIITYVFIPLKDYDIDFDYQFDIDDHNIQVEEYVLQKTKDKITEDISEKLNEKSIAYNQIELHIHKQSNGIQIENIYICGVPDRQRELAEQTLDLGNVLVFGD